MSDVRKWPKQKVRDTGEVEHALPRSIMRPCDWGLIGAVNNLETQLGSIEAYNRLVLAAIALKAKIDAGQGQPQNPMFANDTGARK